MPELFHFDLAAYMSAINAATSIDYSHRVKLYDMYESAMLDLHLSGVLDKRIRAVRRLPIEFQRDGEPDERIKGWIASLAEAGIGIAFVSNNDWERVELFNRTLGVPANAKSGKPFKKNLVKAMNDLGGTLDTTVMLGDQLLTDALAGHNLGVKCLIVPPIRDKKNAFFKFKRWLEKPVVKKFKKRNGIGW